MAKTCGVVVTYQPAGSVIGNVKLLSDQFPAVVIVDNGSADSFQSLLAELEAMTGVSLVRNPSNLGIAAALNLGIRQAQKMGFEWVATFDQDSTITPDYIESMMSAHEACPLRGQVALISPVHCASEKEWLEREKAALPSPYSMLWVAMTSGSLIKMKVFDEGLWYDDALFIDYVDFDFCLRLGQRGYKTIQSARSCLIHNLGTLEKHSFLGLFPVSIKSHSATRYYYIMRNRLVMYRRFAMRFPMWAAHDMLWLCMDWAKILLFESDKTAKLINAIKGFGDGIRGRLGPFTAAAKK
jgi:rhamnosyltransferase